jgi:signal transduction histidine kinase
MPSARKTLLQDF